MRSQNILFKSKSNSGIICSELGIIKIQAVKKYFHS